MCKRDQIAKLAANLGLLLGVGGTALFDVAKIDEIVELVVSTLEQLSDLGNPQLNQSGPADGLLHPQLPALHTASEIHFAFTGQQRNGAHFAQVHAYRVVGINRFFGLLCRELLFLNFLRMEEISFFVERKSEGFVALC